TFYFAVVRDHFVITANRGLAERWVNGTRQSYVDRLSATHKKMAVSNNAFYMTLDLARYGRLIFAGTAGRRSSKRERGLAILNALGSLAMNMFPTPAGFDSYFLWTPGPGGVTAAVHALFELAALTGVRSEERSQACKAKCASAIAEARRKCPLGPSHAACVKVVDDAAINCAKACEKY
ncbi:MAG: hypothetical protein KC609_21980, partial [Myxococcales bacterium]|nr:hypothetical protein [Myxococcales bacterium]